MKDLTIGKRVVIGTSILCLIITALSVFSMLRIRSLNHISDAIVKDSLPGVIQAGRMKSLQSENQLRCAIMLVAKDAEQRKELKRQIDEIAQKISEASSNYEATIFDQDDRNNFEAMKQARKEFRAVKDTFYAMVDANNPAAADYFINTVTPSYENYAKTGEKLVTQNADSGAADGKILSDEVKADLWIIALVGLGGLVTGILSSGLIVKSIGSALRSIANQISDGANQTASASMQVSTASQTLAEGASEQAASIEETSASLEELSTMTKRNADNAQKANDFAREARVAADKGVRDMQEMSGAMDAIKASSDDIAKIIRTIDEIAFQTNILALNAAVEAARAGEAGMGFAVVADEVRNLAQRSAQAAKETAAKIEGAIAKTDQGVEISRKVGEGLNEIVTKARQVDELVAEVAGASHEQTQGITQINSAMGQMDKVTQSNAATAEESASAAEELSAQATALKEAVNDLLKLAGATHDSAYSSDGQSFHKPPTPLSFKKSARQNQPTRDEELFTVA